MNKITLLFLFVKNLCLAQMLQIRYQKCLHLTVYSEKKKVFQLMKGQLASIT